MKIQEKFNKKLLVEGNDDRHVMWALCKEHKVDENFDVIDCEGFDNLKERIPIMFKTPGIETIGIVVDADECLQSRWEVVRGCLSIAGFKMPSTLPETGLIVANDSYKVGVWIMPNNNANGTLEDFISFLVPNEDKLLPVVQSTLDDIESRKLNKYAPTHKSKAAIHTWLAWQAEPGTPMGLSITKRYLSVTGEVCHKFVEWLVALFGV
jgi:hypothetical protein